MTIDPALLAILRCPLSNAPLLEDGDALISTDRETRRRYRIDARRPVLFVEEAETLSLERWEESMRRLDGRGSK